MSDDIANALLKQHDAMFNKRSNFNVLWTQVAQRIAANYDDFIKTNVEGIRRTDMIFESTATLALEHFCAALESMLCPASQRWHHLRASDPALQEDQEVQMYLDQVVDCLFRARYAPSANFQSQIHEVFYQIGAFGNGPMLVDDVMGYGLRYRALHLAKVYGEQNSAGVIDLIHREYDLTARAAMDAVQRNIFDEDLLPEEIKQAATQTPERKYTFMQCVYPNPDVKPGRPGPNGMAFLSKHLCKDFKCIVKESGYHTQPIFIARYRVSPTENYGRGPGVDVFPDISMLQEMEKTSIRQMQRAVDPPILLADDGALSVFDLRSNAMNYGALSPEGRPLAVPFQTGSNLQVAVESLNQKRAVVEKAFLVDIFSILVNQPQMTATEVLQRAQEKGQLLAPIIGRIQSELFGPMITREIDILHRAGMLPPPPDKILQNGNFSYDIVYEAELQSTQKQSKALAISRVLQQAAPLMQIDPSIPKSINALRTLQILVDSNSAPPGMLNTPEEMQQSQDAEQQQAQLNNIAQLAGPASQAIKNLAQAQAAGGAASPGNLIGMQQ